MSDISIHSEEGPHGSWQWSADVELCDKTTGQTAKGMNFGCHAGMILSPATINMRLLEL